MDKTVFITRELSADSIFYQTLTNEGWLVTGISLVELTRQPFETLPLADWYFFYSQNGVDFFMETLKMQQFFVSPSVRWAALGEATAKRLQKYTQKVDFIGNGHPETVAEDFLKQAIGQSVLFIQAEQSKQSIEKILAGKIEIAALTAYNNQPKQQIVIPQTSVVVFTSPLNVQVFMKNKQNIKCTQKMISIGETTAQTLDTFGVLDFASNPSEKALAEAVFVLSLKNK